MPYDATIRRYLRDLQTEYTSALRGGQHTAELSYRVPMHNLFTALSRDLNPAGNFDIVLEPRNQGRVGRPDWRIHDSISLGVYGYIEGKGLSPEPFNTTPYAAQIEKYLTLGHKLVISDGLDFVFSFPGATPIVVSLIDKGRMGQRDWSRLDPNPQFKFYMEQFFSNPTPQQVDEEKLVELVAIRTRNLANEILEYADLNVEEAINEDERQIIEVLTGMRNLVYTHNDQNMRKGSVFADFTAQVIMFCLLYAHRVICASDDSPPVKAEKIRAYAFNDITDGEELLPFRNLMVYLRDYANERMFIHRWVDECVLFLSFVQMSERQLLNPDYHRLFELFLTKYDPKARFDYGAYYTPKVLSSFVVRLTNAIVSEQFEGATIYDDRNTIIDPCCGTGSFLEEIITADTHDGTYNLGGIEILPAPYMLANYRMAVVRRQLGERSFSRKIVLANTLNNAVLGAVEDGDSIEGRELRRAKELAEPPITLIIGNPPCSDSARSTVTDDFSIINELMDDFRPPQDQRHSRQNIQKQISNPFMMFLRWSCEKLLQSENHSVLAMVVPLSFLEAESFKYARKYLVERFSKLWAIAIDADARTGMRSDSLFHTLQGRAVIVVTRKLGDEAHIAECAYADYTHGNRAEKESALEADVETILSSFDRFAIPESTYSFVPTRQFNETLYSRFWPVSDQRGQSPIFLNQCSGAKMAPTSLFTHVKPAMLKRRSREIASEGAEAADRWVGRQDKPASGERVAAFKAALSTLHTRTELDATLDNAITPISFRPFVNSYAVLWDPLIDQMSAVGGNGTRIRPEIRKLYNNEGTIGFSLAHAPKDISESLGQFASFCWHFPDNDLTRRGNGHIYCNQYVGADGEQIINNIAPALLDAIQRMTGLTSAECAKKCVFYTYAILCSQVFMDEFYGALFTVNQSDRRCRIPIVNSGDAFLSLADLGEKIALLEKDGETPENLLDLDYETVLASLPAGFQLEHGRAVTQDPFDIENEELILRNSQHTQEIRVYCPIAIQNFTVSGYNVIKDCWLKFHSHRFTNCDLTREELTELLNLLNSIAVQMRYVAQVDEYVHRIISGDLPLLNPITA